MASRRLIFLCIVLEILTCDCNPFGAGRLCYFFLFNIFEITVTVTGVVEKALYLGMWIHQSYKVSYIGKSSQTSIN